MLWGKDDKEARWIHGICGVFFAAVALALGYYILISGGASIGETSLCLGSAYFSLRCFWYAFTGENNLNRDNF